MHPLNRYRFPIEMLSFSLNPPKKYALLYQLQVVAILYNICNYDIIKYTKNKGEFLNLQFRKTAMSLDINKGDSMVFDFFQSSEDAINHFCKHFGINKEEFRQRLLTFDYCHQSPVILVQEFGIDLKKKTDDCEIVCRHITTCNDNLESIKKYGMLRLDEVLSQKTFLHIFLKEHGIESDPVSGSIRIGNNTFEMVGLDELPPSRNSFQKHVALLHNKLYHDKSEVEMFISGSDEELLSYDSVTDAPEILMTVDRIMGQCTRKGCRNLQKEWAELPNMKRYILEFTIPLTALETNTDRRTFNGYQDDEEWYEVGGFSFEEYENGGIPIDFYRNKRLVEMVVDYYFGRVSNPYGQVVPSFRINPEEIKVYKVSNVHN